ncbi:MAG: hypothetical protein GY909_15190 [Oligoflexia bacterium]|nr:hypothetical protein [Oligoflexia bacterium]
MNKDNEQFSLVVSHYVLLIALCVGLFFSAKSWVGKKTQARCIPTKVKGVQPFIEYLPGISSYSNNNQFLNFISHYVSLTEDLKLKNFKVGLDNRIGQSNVALSESFKEAMHYSIGEELTKNKLKFIHSHDDYVANKRSGLSYRFNIVAIGEPVVDPGHLIYTVNVYGEYQADQGELKKDLWGHRQLTYKIIAGSSDSKNRDGFYVLDSSSRYLSRDEFDFLRKKNFFIKYELE